MSYLDVATFKVRSVMPAEDIDALIAAAPGFLDAELAEWSSRMDSVLRKRYAVPFTGQVPDVVKGWLARLVTPRAYLRRGVNPSDAQFEEIKADAAAAWVEVKEAADSSVGLYDLPLAQTDAGSAVVSGGPQAYSETSPYRAFDIQRADAGAEDVR